MGEGPWRHVLAPAGLVRAADLRRWLAPNLYGVTTCMADARAMELPLVNVGGGEPLVGHDWNYRCEWPAQGQRDP